MSQNYTLEFLIICLINTEVFNKDRKNKIDATIITTFQINSRVS